MTTQAEAIAQEFLSDIGTASFPGSDRLAHRLGRRLAPAGEAITSPRFNAVGDGVTDDRAAIQAAIDWSAANQKAVVIPDGDYLIGSALYARSNATIVCSPQARLLRNYSALGTTGLLMNETMTSAVSNFRWSGGVIRNPDPVTLAGNSVCLNADSSVVEDLFLDEWGANNRAMLLFGDKLTVRRIRAVSAYDGGGIRYAGGDDFRCSDCYIEAGDDCYQFVPPATTGSTLFDSSITRGQYVNCHGYSTNARLMVAALVSASETLHMTASITDCAFIGVRGRGRQFLAIDNSDSTGSITRLDVIGCHCDSTGESGAPVGSLWINRNSGAGEVSNIRIEGTTVLAPELEALEIAGAIGYPIGPVTVDRCYLDASRTAATATVITVCSEGFALLNSTVTANGTDGVLIGSGTNTATNTVIAGSRFTEIDNGVAGVRFNAATGWTIRDCVFVERSGQTTARAITFSASTATKGRVYPSNYDGLTAAAKIFASGTGNADNKIFGSGLTSDSGGSTMRSHESGQTRTNGTATTQQTYTLPPATQGMKYSFTVTGTGMMAIACTGTDVIRQGASVTTATTGRLTSTARGDAVTIEAVDSSTWQVTSAIGSWTVT